MADETVGRVGHDKVYEVVRATTRPMGDTLDVDGHKVKLDRNGRGLVTDPGLARALNERHGWETPQGDASVVVTELEAYNETRHRGRTERFVFSVPDLPWKKNKDDADEN